MSTSVDRAFRGVLGSLPTDIDPRDGSEEGRFPLDLEGVPDDPSEWDAMAFPDVERGDAAADLLGERAFAVGVGDEDRELIEGGLRAKGFEAIAFYKSPRFTEREPFPGRWGIFYLREGLAHVASLISDTYPGFSHPRRLAHGFLRAHEHFHFQADLQTLLLEGASGRHLYLPTRRLLRGKRTEFVEEALANKNALNWANRKRVGIEEFASDFMLCQPGAYARFEEPYTTLAGEWMSIVLDGAPPGSASREDLAPWVHATPETFLRRSVCPEWVIFTKNLSKWIDPVFGLPPVSAIDEDERVIRFLDRSQKEIRQAWDSTKRKILENPYLPGLHFKPWPPLGDKAYSVRVSHRIRAHLRFMGEGRWLAVEIGGHGPLGHGH
jgi:hypothetical protein